MEIKESDIRNLSRMADCYGKAYLKVTRESIQMGCGGQIFSVTDLSSGHWSGKPCVTIGVCHEYSKPILLHGLKVS